MSGIVECNRPSSVQLIDEEFFRSPYAAYARLREAGPLYWSEEFLGGAWLLTRHDDVELVLRDTRFSARRTGRWVMGVSDTARQELRQFQSLFSRALLFRDGLDHQRIRSVLAPAFHPAALHRLASEVDALVQELLEGIDISRGFDFIHALAQPLPVRVMMKLMGISEAGHTHVVQWSDALAEFLGAPAPTLDQTQRAHASLGAMSQYFREQLAQRAAPEGTVLERLSVAVAQGRIGDGPELLAQCVMLLFAGHETTRNALGNGFYHLLDKPHRYAQLCRNPEMIRSAVRELLRFDSPVQYSGRRVAHDMVLHGQRLRRGEAVIALIGSANRDPRRHDNPDHLDLTRRSPGLLSFGQGPHVCIGAMLTLLEVETVIRQLVKRWQGLQLISAKLQWQSNPLYRGLTSLPMCVQ